MVMIRQDAHPAWLQRVEVFVSPDVLQQPDGKGSISRISTVSRSCQSWRSALNFVGKKTFGSPGALRTPDLYNVRNSRYNYATDRDALQRIDADFVSFKLQTTRT
jgi:hypothetical protein